MDFVVSLEGKRMNCPCKLIATLLSRLTAIVLATFQSQGNNALMPTLLNCLNVLHLNKTIIYIINLISFCNQAHVSMLKCCLHAATLPTPQILLPPMP